MSENALQGIQEIKGSRDQKMKGSRDERMIFLSSYPSYL
jgi:hypothetical protein